MMVISNTKKGVIMKSVNHIIFNYLKEKKLTIGFCESASAGALTSMFCEQEGVSSVFKGSIIAYQNEIKNKLLGINQETLEKYGAVSYQVAEQMAKNAAKILNVDICISITGNASNNTMENKPACMYYLGIFIIDHVEVFQVSLLNKERNYNRFNIALYALNKLMEFIK